MHKASIFHDPSGRRRRRVNVTLGCLGLGTALIVGLGLYSVIEGPILSAGRDLVNLSHASGGLARVSSEQLPQNGERKLEKLGNRPLPEGAETAERLAYFDVGDPLSHMSLTAHAKDLDGIIGNFLVIDQKSRRVRQTARDTEERVRRKLAGLAPSLKIYASIASALSPAETAAAISSPALRQDMTDAALAYVRSTETKGLVIALGGLPEQASTYVFDFVRTLSAAMKKEGREVIVTGRSAPTKAALQDLARLADRVIVTNEAFADDPAMLSAPQPQGPFEATLQDYAAIIPARKLVVSIGAYACERTSYGECQPMPVEAVWRLADSANAQVTLDRTTLNSRVSLIDGVGRTREFWVLDAVSVFNAVRASLSHAASGIALRALGQEDPSVWSIYSKGRSPDRASAAELVKIPRGLGIEPNVLESEIIAGKGGRTEGSRQLDYDPALDLITSARIETSPKGKAFQGWSPPDRTTLAITFDDGPDDKITPKILDVLKEKGVSATFFVIGRNVLKHPDILRRIDAEGHDIGNHTFSHPR